MNRSFGKNAFMSIFPKSAILAVGEVCRRSATAAAAIALAAVLLCSAALSAPFPAGEILMSQSGFENWLWQKFMPREQRLDQIATWAQALEARLSEWEDAHLYRLYLWPDDTTVEYYAPGGVPAGTGALDVPPRIVEGRTMVPLRFVGEALGAEVGWNEEHRQVTYSAGSRRIVLTVGQKIVYIEDSAEEIDIPPMIINGRTMVPVRFVSQWLGAVVQWDEAASRVEIRYRQNVVSDEHAVG